MSSRGLAVVVALVGVLLAASGLACTTVCLLEPGRALVAYNYDFDPSEGLVLVNKRGTAKQSRLERGGARWTARHGSVTFNQFGRDQPLTGMNVTGVMGSVMWLDETRYPAPDERPALGVLEWVQYHLDLHASVAEVVAAAATVRPTSRAPLHYLFADASGDAAVLEFLDGRLRVHRGATLPVRALANSTYADSLAAFETARRTGQVPTARGSLDRFVRGALLAGGSGDPIARGFALLASVANPGYTRWSVVYDLGAGEIHFRTDTNDAVRRLSLAELDFSCRTPVRMLDVTAPGEGDVGPRLRDYTPAANRALVEAAYAKTPFLTGAPAAERAAVAEHPDRTSSCATPELTSGSAR